MQGNVVRKIDERGFGFIIGEDKNDYFFHMSELKDISWKEIKEGDTVAFSPNNNDDKKVAKCVRKFYGKKMEKATEQSKVYPGLHPMVMLTSYSEDEQKIVNTLSKTFYI